jgi:F0F1-type ATP synthase membrane subunit c/vacuolar-type H+-ATPase subunit K
MVHGIGVVQRYRSSTEVQVLYIGAGVVQVCRSAGIVQGYTGARLVQLYGSSIGLQGARRFKGVQV